MLRKHSKNKGGVGWGGGRGAESMQQQQCRAGQHVGGEAQLRKPQGLWGVRGGGWGGWGGGRRGAAHKGCSDSSPDSTEQDTHMMFADGMGTALGVGCPA